MKDWVIAFIPVVIALIPTLATYVMYRRQRNDKLKDATNDMVSQMARLLMGLAYAQIVKKGMSYIERGSITKDEFEDFRNYFYEPYKALGGNGVAERIMKDVEALPFKNPRVYYELNRPRSEQEHNNVRWETPGLTRASIEQP